MDLMDLRGPDFLKVYAVGFAAMVALGLLFRRMLRGPSGEPPREAMALDPMEVAYLTGGPRLAINTALASLYRQESVGLTAGTRSLVAQRPPADGATAFEQGLYRYVSTADKRAVREVHRNFPVEMPALRPSAFGLALSPARRAAVGAMSVLPLLLLMLAGVVKVGVGVSRNRPVVFLVMFLIASLFAVILFLAKLPWRTITGDRALEQLRSVNAALFSTARSDPVRLSPAELALAMGLFGPVVLAGDDEMNDLRQAIHPPNNSAGSSSSSSCGSGCGSGGGGSSCGGGSGCGGGGGCGGCGGGGCGS